MVEQSSSSIAMEAQSQSSKFVPVTFSNFTTIRLDNNNFLSWRKQVFTAIRGYKLHDFVLGTRTPPKKFLQQSDEDIGELNPEFIDWEQQDQLLVSWLLSTMTEGILSRVINCETSSQVWNTLDQYFASQTRAKVTQYQTPLKNAKKGSSTMNEYMLKKREVVNLLGMAGEIITAKEHIVALFSGLNEDYENFITNFDLRNQINSVEEVESNHFI